MELNKEILIESLGVKSTGAKHFTNNKKQSVIISEKQLERLVEKYVNEDENVVNIDIPSGSNVEVTPKDEDMAEDVVAGIDNDMIDEEESCPDDV
tara:strand:- start:373 stop:657 length:285 start_codon:yes stop_codon:yes gene_type:complete